MALAAVAYARATDRRQVMVATTSVGPGALNMVTAAGVAHANRLPVLLLPGRHLHRPRAGSGAAAGRALRRPDHDGQRRLPPGLALLRPDHPARAAARTLPQVARVLTDPADCGPVTLALPQDVQAEEYDFPDAMFAPTAAPRPAAAAGPRRRWPTRRRCCAPAQRPLLVLGGGVRYSGAGRGGARVRRAARRPGGRDRGRPHAGAARPPAVRRAARHHRLDVGQHAGRGGGRRARRRHPAAGLHHGVLDGLRPATSGSSTVNAARFDAVKHNAARGRRRRPRDARASCRPRSATGPSGPSGRGARRTRRPRGTRTSTGSRAAPPRTGR